MRQSIEEAVIKINEGRVEIDNYAGISCETCIHNKHHAFEDPCRSCSSAKHGDERDYRTSTRHHWAPNKLATPKAIARFYKLYPRLDLEFFESFPPERCINPRCRHDYPTVFERGLCWNCHRILEEAVDFHRVEARDLLILASLSESEYEFEACMTEFERLFSWYRFARLGIALPKEEDYDGPLRELGLQAYYEAAKKNRGKTPTRRQLRTRGVSEDKLIRLAELVTIK